MKTTKDGRRQFSRPFKIAAVRRVMEGEALGAVARDLGVSFGLLFRWHKVVKEKGEEYLYSIGERTRSAADLGRSTEASLQRRVIELERMIGKQQMEIRFLDKALRRVEELRREKNDDGAAASSKT